MTRKPIRTAPPSAAQVSHRAVTAVVCIALAAVVAAMASLNVALPSVARSTHASQTQLAWVIDAYSLVFASLLLPAGAIGDRYGRRRALLIGLAIFGGGSVVAMSAGSASMLIVLRGVLGVGAALVMPATLSTITSTFPPGQRTRAVGVWAAVAGASALLGLLVSGALLAAFSWQAVFGVNVVLAALAVAGTLRFVPESADSEAPRLDAVGAIIAVVGLVAIVFSVIEAPGAGWLSARTVAGVGGGLVVLAGFVVWELRQDSPMLDPRIFRRPPLSAGSMSIFIQFFAFFGFAFVVLQYLQIVRGEAPILASVSMVPLAAGLVLASKRAPGLVARLGARAVCVAGLGLIAAGMLVLAQMSVHTSYLLQLGGIVPVGVGMGLAMTPATSGITEALPAGEQGVGSALNDLSRELGGALGIAVIGSVLTAIYRSDLHLPGAPASIVTQARSSLAAAAKIGGSTATEAHAAFVSGLHLALICAAAAAGVAAVLVGILLAPRDDPVTRYAYPVTRRARSERRDSGARRCSQRCGGPPAPSTSLE